MQSVLYYTERPWLYWVVMQSLGHRTGDAMVEMGTNTVLIKQSNNERSFNYVHASQGLW